MDIIGLDLAAKSDARVLSTKHSVVVSTLLAASNALFLSPLAKYNSADL
jgi:hypothetical protein